MGLFSRCSSSHAFLLSFSFSLSLSFSFSLSLSLSRFLSLSLSFSFSLSLVFSLSFSFSLSLSLFCFLSVSHSSQEREREGERERVVTTFNPLYCPSPPILFDHSLNRSTTFRGNNFISHFSHENNCLPKTFLPLSFFPWKALNKAIQ